MGSPDRQATIESLQEKFTPGMQNAFEIARRTAIADGATMVLPGHLLEGLATAPGEAQSILDRLEFDVTSWKSGRRFSTITQLRSPYELRCSQQVADIIAASTTEGRLIYTSDVLFSYLKDSNGSTTPKIDFSHGQAREIAHRLFQHPVPPPKPET